MTSFGLPFRLIVTGFILSALPTACSTGTKTPDISKDAKNAATKIDFGKAPDRSAVRGLTQEYAKWRSLIVSEPDYNLSLSLSPDEKEFSGVELIEFKVNGKPRDIALDFADGTIQSFSINGKAQPVAYNGFFLNLPADALTEGLNSVAITFSHKYSNTGDGLARFTDPEDGGVYTYTDSEPFGANRVFPCFDQPDLKGRYALKVEAPSAWQVISAIRESSRDFVSPGRVQWIFPKTLPFSTYLISLHCGPYQVWTSQAGSIPLRLFARKSLAKYVPVKDWFLFTKQGLEFYQKYFNRPYPFGKYDQVLVPDFNWGGMENVGAITFGERFVKRGVPTQEERENLASVVLHEMAHMWFGDLVTMKWWNDLWLNESFATFLSTLAMEKNTEFKSAWQGFFIHEKQWAYWSDQLNVTHPVASQINGTEEAFSNFDGITYGKGASVLKQLRFFVGENGFQEGVGNYIRLHAFGNATLSDFISAIEAGSHVNLQNWPKQWLETSGLNSVEPVYTCENGKITKFEILQKATEDHPTLRDHRTRVALMNEKNGNLVVTDEQSISYNTSTVIPQFISKPCPAAVYTNYEDQDFVKPVIDKQTLQTVQKKFGEVKDPFLRQMLWASLWDMVRDGVLPVQEYLSFIYKNLGSEQNSKILVQVLTTVYGFGTGPAASIVYYLPRENDEDRAFRQDQIQKLEAFLWNQLEMAPPGSDLQKRWFDTYVKVAETPGAQRHLQDLLDTPTLIAGFDLDQDRRWVAIVRINSLNPTEGERLEAAELKRDKSNAGLLMSIAAQASRPRQADKAKWIQNILGKTDLPMSQIRTAVDYLFPINQESFRREFSKTYFKSLPEISKSDDTHFQDKFIGLAPVQCNAESTYKLDDYVKSSPRLSASMIKELKITQQEDQRCMEIRKVAHQGLVRNKH